MPHVEITAFPGRDGETKARLAERTRDFIAEALKVDPKAVTVSIRDVPREQWMEHVKSYKDEDLFIKPEYRSVD